jgi:hypothetical protein
MTIDRPAPVIPPLSEPVAATAAVGTAYLVFSEVNQSRRERVLAPVAGAFAALAILVAALSLLVR